MPGFNLLGSLAYTPVDGTGQPYAGALCYVYRAGTSTPATTYTTSALTVARSHPVVASDAGAFPPVWASGETDYDYRVRITTAAGVQLLDVDNIPRSAPSSGPTEFAQTATELGAGVTPVALEYLPGDVRRYGAVGTGLVNDYNAFFKAIAQAAAGGAPVYVPPTPAHYRIDAQVVVLENVTLYGAGPLSAIKQYTANQHGLVLRSGATIRDVKIIGTNASGAVGGVFCGARNKVALRNCVIQSWKFGTWFAGCKDATIANNVFYGGSYDASSSSDVFIYGTTAAPSNRILVEGNFCLSMNDSGINVNSNAGDRDITIANNVIMPLDADGLTPLADAANWRRNGIIISYNGGYTARVSVTGNMVRDIPYAGIYLQCAAAAITNLSKLDGDVNITGNNVTRCGFGGTTYPSDVSLRAGILLIGGGVSTVTGNVVNDCSIAGIKVASSYAHDVDYAPRHTVSSNTVARTLGYGIWLTIRPYGTTVVGNRVVNSTDHNIYFEGTNSDSGNCAIVGNHVDSYTANKGGIVIDATNSGWPVSVSGNFIKGFDNSTNNEFNSGIWFKGDVHCTSNTIDKFHRGINCATSLARTLTLNCSGNSIHNCVYGVNSAGAGPWVIGHNTYSSVTTPANGSAYQGTLFQGQGLAATIHTQTGSAAPTTGTWAVGDHVVRHPPAAGSAKGWYCTTAGTPGTWTSEGNL